MAGLEDREEPWKIEYLTTSGKCLYCGAPAVRVRVALAESGNISVAELCQKHSDGEFNYHLSENGFEPVGGLVRGEDGEIYSVKSVLVRSKKEPI